MTARSVAAAGLAAAIAIAAAAGARAACTDETRSSLYQSFTASFRGDPSAQKQADDIAQRFLDDCARDDGPTLYVHRWHVLYVRATEAYQLAVALQQGRYPDALSLGADLIRRGDTDTPVMINLAVGGYRALAAKTAGVDLGAALRAAKIAIDALQRPDADSAAAAPFASKEVALDTLGKIEAALAQALGPAGAAAAPAYDPRTAPDADWRLVATSDDGDVKVYADVLSVRRPAGHAQQWEWWIDRTPREAGGTSYDSLAIERRVDCQSRASVLLGVNVYLGPRLLAFTKQPEDMGGPLAQTLGEAAVGAACSDDAALAQLPRK